MSDEADRVLHETAGVLARRLVGGEWPGDAPALLRPLLEPGLLRAFAERDLRRLASGAPPLAKDAPAGQLRLHASPALDLRVRIVGPHASSRRTIATLARPTVVGNGGRAAFALRCWHLPPDAANDVFDPAVRIEPAADVRLEPGEAHAFRAGTQAYEIVPAARVAVAVIAAGPRTVPLCWHYDRTTLRPVRAEPARNELLLRELLAFAAMMGEAALAPAVAEVAGHPSHFVRWAAAQAAFRIAPDDGRAALRALSDDPHPQLRVAARRLLAQTEAR